jgi:hypothetical protein
VFGFSLFGDARRDALDPKCGTGESGSTLSKNGFRDHHLVASW